MGYGKDLLAAAAEKAGSRYALARITGLSESDLSKAANGKRDVPASWVLKLARVAGIDPTEAMEFHDLERAEKKRARRLLSRSVLVGVVVICAIFASSDNASARLLRGNQNPVEIGLITHRIASRFLLWLRRRRLFIRAAMTAEQHHSRAARPIFCGA